MADRLFSHMRTRNSVESVATDTTMYEGEENGKMTMNPFITEARTSFDKIIKDVELLSRELYHWKGSSLENDEVAKSICRFAESWRAFSLAIRQNDLESLPLLHVRYQRLIVQYLHGVETAVEEIMQQSRTATPVIKPRHGITLTSLLLESATQDMTMATEIMEDLLSDLRIERPEAPAMNDLAGKKSEVSTSK
jgi:hypothetical protein